MKRLRDTEFFRTLPESISEILLQVFMIGGAVIALLASSLAGSWWVFPLGWIPVFTGNWDRHSQNAH